MSLDKPDTFLSLVALQESVRIGLLVFNPDWRPLSEVTTEIATLGALHAGWQVEAVGSGQVRRQKELDGPPDFTFCPIDPPIVLIIHLLEEYGAWFTVEVYRYNPDGADRHCHAGCPSQSVEVFNPAVNVAQVLFFQHFLEGVVREEHSLMPFFLFPPDR